jgi:hypothetical protein
MVCELLRGGHFLAICEAIDLKHCLRCGTLLELNDIKDQHGITETTETITVL